MDRGAWWATVHGVAKSQTRLNDFTSLQTMVELMKIMGTSFKGSHACTAMNAPSPAAGCHRPTPPLETPGHSRASLGQSLGGSLLLSPGSWCTQGSVCALQESISQSCVSSGSSMVGLMAPPPRGSMPYPSLLHPEPLSLWQSTADVYLHRRCSNTVCLSLCGAPGSWRAQGLFESSEHLWWKWGLIPNVNSPVLPSCWGFSFALGRGLSPHSRSRATQQRLQRLWFCCRPFCLI